MRPNFRRRNFLWRNLTRWKFLEAKFTAMKFSAAKFNTAKNLLLVEHKILKKNCVIANFLNYLLNFQRLIRYYKQGIFSAFEVYEPEILSFTPSIIFAAGSFTELNFATKSFAAGNFPARNFVAWNFCRVWISPHDFFVASNFAFISFGKVATPKTVFSGQDQKLLGNT